MAEIADGLEARIAELERKVRSRRSLGTVLTVALLAVFIMGLSGPSKAVDSEAFVVRDSQNRKRAALQVDLNGFPSLTLYDEAGKTKADLAIVLDHPQLNLYNDAGKTSLEAAIGTDGNPGIWLVDGNGKERAVLQLFEDNSVPVIKLSDSQGRPRIVAAVGGPSGQPIVQTMGPDGKSLWRAPAKP